MKHFIGILIKNLKDYISKNPEATNKEIYKWYYGLFNIDENTDFNIWISGLTDKKYLSIGELNKEIKNERKQDDSKNWTKI